MNEPTLMCTTSRGVAGTMGCPLRSPVSYHLPSSLFSGMPLTCPSCLSPNVLGSRPPCPSCIPVTRVSRGSSGVAAGVASATKDRTGGRCATARRCGASGRSSSPRRGRTSGSAPPRTATSRPSARTRRDAGSTATGCSPPPPACWTSGSSGSAARATLKALGTEGELLRYRRAKGGWDDVRSEDINDYLRELVGCEVTAKDFRTWHATVLAAVGLAVSRHAPASGAARKRAVTRVMREVAEYLGNTPTVARASYVDPRVVEAYDQDRTIGAVLTELGADADYGQLATHGTVERAVIDLIRAV
nr:hypothetical protein [Nonomuraea sp. WAC 01424]